MQDQPLRVIVFYGGDAANGPRDELLAWLRGPRVSVEARRVAEMSPHSKGSVDDRVADAVEWADVAIALLTPDPRSPVGATNVIDEIGYWRGKKGKDTIAILRQKSVGEYSNHAGLVRPVFDTRVKEVFEDVRDFLASVAPRIDDRSTRAGTSPTPPAESFEVDSSGNLILLGPNFVVYSNIEEADGITSVTLGRVSGAVEAFLRSVGSDRQPIHVAFANRATLASILDRSIRNTGDGTTVTLRLREANRSGNVQPEMNWGGGSTPRRDANELATLRASRVLFNEPGPVNERNIDVMFGEEMLIRGVGTKLSITRSPIDDVLAQLPRHESHTWQCVRLVMILYLVLGDCVEHVDYLKLTVASGKLKRVQFRGTRRHVYSNVPPFVIQVDKETDY